MRAFDVTEENYALLTDFYELTMSAAYWSNRITGLATFELYFRRLPARRSFILAAGLEQALYYLTHLRFSQEQISWLKKQKTFENIDPGFFEFLSQFQFTGEVWAMPEGTPVFPLEPLIQVRAPIIEAQIAETYLLSILNMQSMIATKAARIVHAAEGRQVIDFGTRRAHGPQAGLLAARASYIGGCIGTSNVLAGFIGKIPTYGTAAHSFTMAFPSELEAFFAYHSVFPDDTTLLIDTYDVLEAARKVKHVPNVKAVRIDSGDLLAVSKKVREILDEDDLPSVKIIASGDLNEYKIHELLAHGAPIDIFGVGTELVTSYDDPAMSGVYKLVQATIEGKEVNAFKTSPGKLSFPGRKQVYRFTHSGLFSHDEICLFQQPPPHSGQPLLEKYIENGKPTRELPDIELIQKHAMQQMAKLSEPYHQISLIEDYPVILSEELKSAMEAGKRHSS